MVPQNDFQGNFPVHEDYETPTREELLAEVQRLKDLYRDKTVNFAGKKRHVIVLDAPQRALLLSQEKKMHKTNQDHVRYTKVEFFRTIKAIVYCLLAIPGIILHTLFYPDEPYEV